MLIQSPAILKHLEKTVPEPPMLPENPVAPAKVRGAAAIIGCDVHPLNDVAVAAWLVHWITQGLAAVEQLIGEHG